MTSLLFIIGLVGALIAIGFAVLMIRKVMKEPEGDEKSVEIAAAIRAGASAYLKRQMRTVIIIIIPVFLTLLLLAFIPMFMNTDFYLISPYAPFAFLTGAFFTGFSGYVGMWIATRANARTATATKDSLNKGLRVSFSAGSVMGFITVGVSLLDIFIWFAILRWGFGESYEVIGNTMIKFGLGVAFMALFARVGGGIFTKAADVGADLVGKVENDIPEDDPRNPAVIADNVGDNVGDVAGMGADLYEAFAHAVIATFALGIGAGFSFAGMLLPILICTVGVIASVIGTFLVRTKEKTNQDGLLKSLHMGTWVASGLTAILGIPIVFLVQSLEGTTNHLRQVSSGGASYVAEYSMMYRNAEGGIGNWIWGIYACILIGIVTGILIGIFTEYYTSDTKKPTQELADSTKTGAATVMIGGVALGLKGTLLPVITVAAAALISFFAAGGAHFDSPIVGLYGIGIAAVGMLGTLGINLATDAFGPVADNAGGIAQMAGMPPEVRKRTDQLDSLGNTTAATGKGFSIGCTAFSAVALLASYMEIVRGDYVSGVAGSAGGWLDTAGNVLDIALTNPVVLVGVFLGAVTAFFFAALTIKAVHKAAQAVVIEVRRQFREILGLKEGKPGVKPDYARCVDMCTQSALRKMVAPGLLTILAPIVIGIVLGPAGVIGFMGGTVVTGFMLALFMMISGGAWDNAKKYVEANQLKKEVEVLDENGNPVLDKDGKPIVELVVCGKGSEEHKAAVIGDTVGDPFKDTAGPSFNILITLSASVAVVFANVAVHTNLLGFIG
ncbi:MAG: sodium-translocating pyrophosphatase [Firmicutes bacterium]|nr:sodium-translocating pyrophosphatase [Bacillota bacterium]